MPGTRQQTVFPNSVFAKPAATPTQKPRPTRLQAARSECARSISAPRSAGMNIGVGITTTLASSFRVPLNQHLPQTIDFLLLNTLIFEEVQDQLLLRILEKAAHQMPNLRALRFLLAHQRRVHMRPSIL